MSRNWWKLLTKTKSRTIRRAPSPRPGPRRLNLLSLEERLTPTALVWTGAGTTNAWNVAANWANPGGNPQLPTTNGTDELTFPQTPSDATSKTGQTIGFTNPLFAKITYTGNGYTVSSGGSFGLATGGTITMTATSGTNTVGAGIALNGVSTAIAVDTGGQLNLNGAMSGAANIIKQGGGILSLGGSNTGFSGDVTVSAGQLTVANANALGNTTGATEVSSGGTLALASGINVSPLESLTLLSGATFRGLGATMTWAGAVNAAGSVTVQVDSSASLRVTGSLSGAGAVTKTGVGDFELRGTNSTYGGNLIVAEGSLEAHTSTALGNTAGTTDVRDGATLTFDPSAAAITSAERILLHGDDAPNGALRALSGNLITLSGTVELRTDSSIRSNGDLVMSGVVTGPGALRKIGSGPLTMTGATPNDYGGIPKRVTTRVVDGVLNLNKSTSGPFGVIVGVVSVPGDLAIDAFTASVVLGRNSQIDSGVDVFVTAGLLDLNNNSNTVHSLTMDGGDVTTGSGTLFLGGNVTGSGTISGNLSLGSATRTFTVGTIGSGTILTVSAAVTGGSGAGITKAGPGQLRLTGASDYSGPTTVSEGSVQISNATALGEPGTIVGNNNTTASGTIVEAGTELIFSGNGLTVAEAIILDGSTLRGTSGQSHTLNGDINVFGSATVSKAGTGVFTLDGDIDGTGSFTKTGSGTVTFTATGSTNGYTGGTFVNEGTLRLAGASTIPGSTLTIGQASGSPATVILDADEQIAASVAVVLPTGTLDVNGQFENIQTLDLTAGTVRTGAGSLRVTTLNTRAASAASTISGTLEFGLPTGGGSFTSIVTTEDGPVVNDLSISAAVKGNAGRTIDKRGPGTLILTGDNSGYIGSITVSEGKLQAGQVNALGTASPGTTVASGGTLIVTTNNGEALTLNGTGVANGGALQDNQANPITLSGPINLASTASVGVQSNGTLTLSGTIFGPGGLTKVGTATLVLTEPSTDNGANIYTGATTVSGGVLRITTATALGATSAGTTVQSGAALEVQGGLTVNEPLTLNGAGIGNGGALRGINANTSGNTTWSGPITLASDATFSTNLGKLTLSNAIGGPGGLRTVGTFSTVALTGAAANTYSGTTVVAGGLHLGKNAGVTSVPGNLQLSAGAPGGGVQVLNPEQIANTATVSIGAGAELRLNAAETIGPLTITDGSVSTFGTSAELILNGDVVVNGSASIGKVDLGNTPRQFTVTSASGRLTLGAAEGGANATLTKDGPGALFLPTAFVGTYTGATVVDDGAMYLFGVTVPLASSSITVNSNGTLAGSGSVNAVNVVGGTLRPGDVVNFSTGAPQATVGTLIVNGNLTLDGNATLVVDLNGTTPGSGHDQVRVTGPTRTVTLGGALLSGTAGTALATGSPLVIISNESNGTTSPPLSTLVDQGGVLVRDTVLPGEAQNFTVGGQQFSVNYAADSGNDVRLTKENTSSAFQNRTITPVIDEGGKVTVSGTIVEPDPSDKFILEINWGDGSKLEVLTFPRGSHGKKVDVTHRYADDGVYAVQLFWHDQHGAGNRATLSTTVRNVAPVVIAGGNVTIRPGEELDRTGSFTDPGADKWTATVDYGDGSGPRRLKLDSKNRFDLHHEYDRPGTYRVVVTVTDDNGEVGTAEFLVTVRRRGKHR